MPAGTGPVGIGVAVAGWGMAVPERRVTNEELTRMVDTSGL